MNIRVITLLITGTVFTAGLIMGFGGYVFAGDPIDGIDIALDEIPGGRVSAKNYKSSLSNTKTIGQVRMEVGNVLLRYGFGGVYINQVTEALEGNGVYGAELKSFFIAVGLDEGEAQNILLEFDKIGISGDSAQAVSAPDATGAVPSAAEPVPDIDISLDEIPGKQAEPAPTTTPGTGDASRSLTGCKTDSQCSVGMVCFKGLCIPAPPVKGSGDPLKGLNISKACCTKGCDNICKQVADFLPNSIEELKIKIEALKAFESDGEREEIRKELRASRKILQENTQFLRQNLRVNAQELRDNFRENVRATIGHVDHGKTGRIALAHGKGLRMINRYRSAIARFDHILGRMESRIEKIGIETEAQARAKGKTVTIFPPENLVILIEEAKNTQALNKARLVELEAKYESLLLGKNPGGIAEEARAIAKELKSEIEKLHTLLVIGPTLILDIPDDFLPPYTQNIDTFGRSGQDLIKKIAQSFEFASQQTIKQIKIKVRENHNPTDGIEVSLQTDTDNRPSGVTLSSALKSRQQLLSYGLDDSSFTQITFNLNNTPSLSPNTKYWIVVARENEAPFDNNNYYELRNYADVYSDGEQLNYRTCDGIDTWVLAGLTCADVDSGGVIGGGTIGIGGIDLPGGGLVIGGGQVVEFDIDLELWTTMRPILDMLPVR